MKLERWKKQGVHCKETKNVEHSPRIRSFYGRSEVKLCNNNLPFVKNKEPVFLFVR